jgi:26S proteasome regulatory subunit N7|eukprot:TRINITY_DN44399_c0_g1_i1.p1 TRINITY_DN44399_c0_g1~~TRINITY_DN44399_c0_g1_i1.p1  ORF type:complete len:413 (-),score=97.92 TRINITY_DN44399_c0_g1_i1:182-1339(-)
MAETPVQTYPIMALAQKRSLLLDKNCQEREELSKEVLDIVKKNGMLPYYETYLCPGVFGVADEALKAELKKQNEEELAKLEEKIKDAKENLGDTEIRDALSEKAEFYNKIGDKASAIEAYEVAYEKTLGVGGRLDNILTLIRIALFFDDKEFAKKQIDRAKIELKKGGDWERRNKLKVYEGMYLMITRSWKDAANLFLNVMPTFTATELVEFKDFVFYTVVLTMVALDRPTIREKLVNSPEVLSAVKETPHLQDFMESYFYCRYGSFMVHFVPLIDKVRADRYLFRHCRHFMRIMRLNAYRQFLASYRSVKLEAMGNEFGVSASFMDAELSSFISSGKLTCKIDKVGGVIESNESEARSQVYVEIIKHGDLLLNRMQKISGALDM